MKLRKETRAYAWEFEGMLCRWAEPYREELEISHRPKPTPDAKSVPVVMLRLSEYRELVRRAEDRDRLKGLQKR